MSNKGIYNTINVLIVILLNFSVSIYSNVYSQGGQAYLAAAEKTANWLISMENQEYDCDGLSWPWSDVNDFASPGLCSGTAGVGLFFLNLYQATGDTLYLEKAKRAANYIYHEHRYVYMYGPDWFTGAASGGHYFLELYKETKESDHLEKAKFFADWLFQNKYVENGGYYWKHSPDFTKIYTSIAHGAAGIGLFFLNLFEQSQESKYLEYAEKAFDWLKNHTVQFGEASIGWKRLTRDNHAYHLWCGGSTGIVFFLKKLYELTGNELYYDYLEWTANGLVEHAVRVQGGSAWYYTSQSQSGLPIIYCHGTTSTVHALYEAFSIIQDSVVVQCARSGANWCMKEKRSSNSNSYFWTYFRNSDWVETGLLTGVASVGYAFVKYYPYDPDPEYLRMARGAAGWLLNIADYPAEDQMRWINYTSEQSSMSEKQYYTGWYHGAAGIGIFLLELYETLGGSEQPQNDDVSVPSKYGIIGNSPNPFNAHTQIVFNLRTSMNVTLEVYNSRGQKIKTLVRNVYYSRGFQSVLWAGDDNQNKPVGTGVYVIRMISREHTDTRKLILMR